MEVYRLEKGGVGPFKNRDIRDSRGDQFPSPLSMVTLETIHKKNLLFGSESMEGLCWYFDPVRILCFVQDLGYSVSVYGARRFRSCDVTHQVCFPKKTSNFLGVVQEEEILDALEAFEKKYPDYDREREAMLLYSLPLVLSSFIEEREENKGLGDYLSPQIAEIEYRLSELRTNMKSIPYSSTCLVRNHTTLLGIN